MASTSAGMAEVLSHMRDVVEFNEERFVELQAKYTELLALRQVPDDLVKSLDDSFGTLQSFIAHPGIDSKFTADWYGMLVQHLEIFLAKRRETQEISQIILPIIIDEMGKGGFSKCCYGNWGFEALVKLVKTPEQAEEVVALIKHRVVDTNVELRRGAFKALRAIAKKEFGLNQAALSLTIQGMRDSEWAVRRKALQVLELLTVSSEQMQQEVLPLIMQDLQNKSREVRGTALWVLNKLDLTDEQISVLLPIIIRGAEDSDRWVQEGALRILGKLSYTPERVRQVMPLVVSGVVNIDVCNAAREVLKKLTAEPAHATLVFSLIMAKSAKSVADLLILGELDLTTEQFETVLPLIIRAMGNKEKLVRSYALRALERLIKTPGQMHLVLPLLVQNIKDRDAQIRRNALEVLERLKFSSPRETLLLIKDSLQDKDANVRRKALAMSMTLTLGGCDLIFLPTALAAEGAEEELQRLCNKYSAYIITPDNKLYYVVKDSTIELLTPLSGKELSWQAFCTERRENKRYHGQNEEYLCAIAELTGHTPYTSVQVEAVFPLIMQGLRGHSDFKEASLEKLRTLRLTSEQVSQVLPLIIQMINDNKGWFSFDPFRLPAPFKALKSLTLTSVQVERVLPLVTWGTRLGDFYVKDIAFEALGKLTLTTTQAAGVLPDLLRTAGNENRLWFLSTSEGISEAFRGLIKSFVQIQEVLALLKQAGKDKDASIRRGVQQVLAMLPVSSQETLPLVIQGLGDKEWKVREAAFHALARLPYQVSLVFAQNLVPENMVTELKQLNINAAYLVGDNQVFYLTKEDANPHLLPLLDEKKEALITLCNKINTRWQKRFSFIRDKITPLAMEDLSKICFLAGHVPYTAVPDEIFCLIIQGLRDSRDEVKRSALEVAKFLPLTPLTSIQADILLRVLLDTISARKANDTTFVVLEKLLKTPEQVATVFPMIMSNLSNLRLLRKLPLNQEQLALVITQLLGFARKPNPDLMISYTANKLYKKLIQSFLQVNAGFLERAKTLLSADRSLAVPAILPTSAATLVQRTLESAALRARLAELERQETAPAAAAAATGRSVEMAALHLRLAELERQAASDSPTVSSSSSGPAMLPVFAAASASSAAGCSSSAPLEADRASTQPHTRSMLLAFPAEVARGASSSESLSVGRESTRPLRLRFMESDEAFARRLQEAEYALAFGGATRGFSDAASVDCGRPAAGAGDAALGEVTTRAGSSSSSAVVSSTASRSGAQPPPPPPILPAFAATSTSSTAARTGSGSGISSTEASFEASRSGAQPPPPPPQ
jgi:HEAT repeat protein